MDIHFARLNQLAFGHWHAQTLFTLAEAGVFDLLHRRPRDAAELADECGLDPHAGTALLDAGVALGLLRRSAEGRYDNGELARSLLVSGEPGSLANWVRVMGRWVKPWTGLFDALRRGAPVDPQSPRIVADPGYLEEFILGMHEYAERTGAHVAAAMALDGACRMVDVGGGAGTYSMALCRRHPQLESVVLDLEPVLAIARRLAEAAGLADRVHTQRCDYRASSFGDGLDAVLLSNVLHQESREVGLDMLGRSLAALRPGGRVVVHGHFLEESRTAPVFATLHNLSARTLWEGGHSYTVAEMAALLAEAGFQGVSATAVSQSSTHVISGSRPAA